MCGKDVGRQGSVTPLSSPCLRAGFWGRQGEGRREGGTSWVLWHPLAPPFQQTNRPHHSAPSTRINVTHRLCLCRQERVMGGSPHVCCHHPGWDGVTRRCPGTGHTHTHTQAVPTLHWVSASTEGAGDSEGPLGSGLGQLLFLTPVSALGRLRAGSDG